MALVEQSFYVNSPLKASPKLAIKLGAAWESLGLVGRRAAVTAAGAILALSCGAAVAGVVRLPAELQSLAQADEMTVQTELPSETAARAYALENPPVYNVQPKADADDTALPSASPDVTIPAEETATKTAYTSSSADDEDKDASADQSRSATTTNDAAASSTAATTDDDSGV